METYIVEPEVDPVTGEEIPETFRVVNMRTGTVYRGMCQPDAYYLAGELNAGEREREIEQEQEEEIGKGEK